MNKSIKELITLARGQLIGRYKPAILAVMLITAIKLVISSVIDTVAGSTTIGYIILLAIEIIVDLLFGALVLGECYFYLKIVRFDETVGIRDIFYGFKNNTDKAIMVQIVFTAVSFITSIPSILINLGLLTLPEEYYIATRLFFIFLPSLAVFVLNLFLGMSFYILCDHPELSPREVLSKSYELMNNQKGRLFAVYLRLIPLYVVGFLALGVGCLWVIALQDTLLADFYLTLTGEEPATAPKTPEPDHLDYSTLGMR